MRTAVVIPVGAGRLDNLTDCLLSIGQMQPKPRLVVLVGDGPEGTKVAEDALARVEMSDLEWVGVTIVETPKHEPGMEQPRNIGVRRLAKINEVAPGTFTHVWFLDSDILVAPDALGRYEEATSSAFRVLVGPYDWLPGGVRERAPDLRNDPRWPSFDSHDPLHALVDDLSAGLACFSGNLLWPIDEFTRIGGFWNELHHGRCEDGEMGLRAVACGVPISYVRGARGWHLDHPVDVELILDRNRRDVPMLNERHPWVEGRCSCCHPEAEHERLTEADGVPGIDGDDASLPRSGPCTVQGCNCTGFKREELFVVEEDGKRFNVRCHCGWEGNTAEIWAHQAACLPEELR